VLFFQKVKRHRSSKLHPTGVDLRTCRSQMTSRRYAFVDATLNPLKSYGHQRNMPRQMSRLLASLAVFASLPARRLRARRFAGYQLLKGCLPLKTPPTARSEVMAAEAWLSDEALHD